MFAIPQGAPLVYVTYSAAIDSTNTDILVDVMTSCANAGVKQVYLMFSTPGGKIGDGIFLYNTLKAMPFNLIIHNIANVDSVGNVIILAGKERYGSPNATFMFHGVGIDITNTRLEEKDCREKLDSILSDQTRMAHVMCQHTKLNHEEIAQLFQFQQEKDAKFALEKGIINEVKELNIVPGAPIVTLVLPH